MSKKRGDERGTIWRIYDRFSTVGRCADKTGTRTFGTRGNMVVYVTSSYLPAYTTRVGYSGDPLSSVCLFVIFTFRGGWAEWVCLGGEASRYISRCLFFFFFLKFTACSIVVDDVDGDCDNNSSSSYSDSHHHQFYFQAPDGQESEVFDDNADARSDISQCSRGSRGSTSREESESRLQQIKASNTAPGVRFLRPCDLCNLSRAEASAPISDARRNVVVNRADVEPEPSKASQGSTSSMFDRGNRNNDALAHLASVFCRLAFFFPYIRAFMMTLAQPIATAGPWPSLPRRIP